MSKKYGIRNVTTGHHLTTEAFRSKEAAIARAAELNRMASRAYSSATCGPISGAVLRAGSYRFEIFQFWNKGAK